MRIITLTGLLDMMYVIMLAVQALCSCPAIHTEVPTLLLHAGVGTDQTINCNPTANVPADTPQAQAFHKVQLPFLW